MNLGQKVQLHLLQNCPRTKVCAAKEISTTKNSIQFPNKVSNHQYFIQKTRVCLSVHHGSDVSSHLGPYQCVYCEHYSDVATL